MRTIYTLIAALSLVLAYYWMSEISATDPWYRNTDMNIHNIADALSLNSGFSLGTVDQPAAPTKFLLALDYRIRNALGYLPTWTLKRFSKSPEPFRELRELVQLGREHSRLLVIAIIILSATFMGRVTQRFELACFTVVLLCGSSGLLFHGLLVRPELLCAAFGGILALHCAWLATSTSSPGYRTIWLVLTGLWLGLALISKLPALLYVVLTFGWCCLVPLLQPATAKPHVPLLSYTLCLLAGMAVLILMLKLSPLSDVLNPVASVRLRFLAVATALLPIIHLCGASSSTGRYLFDCSLDIAVLLAGILAAFVGWFGLLHIMLPADTASIYMAKILNTTIYPDPLLTLLTTPSEKHYLEQIFKFYLETPVLFTTSLILSVDLTVRKAVPMRQGALALMLITSSLGMIFMMSKRSYLEQYSLFTQLPLLLIFALYFANLPGWLEGSQPAKAKGWPLTLAMVSALYFVLTISVPLLHKYNGFQSDAAIPVRDLTITFLYDHDAHPRAYLEVMRKRYPTRAVFETKLNQFLNNPANRY